MALMATKYTGMFYVGFRLRRPLFWRLAAGPGNWLVPISKSIRLCAIWVLNGLQKPFCIFCRKGHRRTATDEDGVNEAVFEARLIGSCFHFVNEAIDVMVFYILVGTVLEEAAIEAFRFAEGNVNICSLCFFCRRRHAH